MFRDSYKLAFTLAAVLAVVCAKAEPESVGAAVEYPSQYYDPSEAEYIVLKKADGQPAHWNRLYNDWGKRTGDQWKNLNHMWGKRSAPVPSRWDKRPQPQWNELSGYWGKRSAQ